MEIHELEEELEKRKMQKNIEKITDVINELSDEYEINCETEFENFKFTENGDFYINVYFKITDEWFTIEATDVPYDKVEPYTREPEIHCCEPFGKLGGENGRYIEYDKEKLKKYFPENWDENKCRSFYEELIQKLFSDYKGCFSDYDFKYR